MYSFIVQEGETKQNNSLVQLRRQILEFQAAEAGRIFRAGYIRKESFVCVVERSLLRIHLSVKLRTGLIVKRVRFCKTTQRWPATRLRASQ